MVGRGGGKMIGCVVFIGFRCRMGGVAHINTFSCTRKHACIYEHMYRHTHMHVCGPHVVISRTSSHLLCIYLQGSRTPA